MFSRSQAGLEYLMTYGWGLILIVTVAGVLFFVLAPPQNNFSCISSDPTKIVLKSYDFPPSPNYGDPANCNPVNMDCLGWGVTTNGDPHATFVLQNATGGQITISNIVVTQPADPSPGWEILYQTPVPACARFKLFSPGNFSPMNVPGGGEFRSEDGFINIFIVGGTSTCPASTNYFSDTVEFGIKYTDQFGYNKNATITCKGYPPHP
ncbi:MAG: hypothetical protein JW772_00015 [Candidatus Diapherotrites archaeon]|nr:hypothetical protein [Candidatus Diapherotrites archaeon]